MSAFADDERLRSIPATVRSVLRDAEAPPFDPRPTFPSRKRSLWGLTYSHRPLLEVSVASGFTSTSHFAQWSRRLHGMRPSELRERSRKGPA
jgi:AraC-like DNA-binding protein